MSIHTIKLEKTLDACKNGTCGHLHEIQFQLKQKQIVCSEMSCKISDVSLVKHIFVPYDDSTSAHRAFEFALDLANKYDSYITVATVIYSSVLGSSFIDIGSSQQQADKEKLVRVEKSFEKIRILAKKFGISVKTEILFSSSTSDSLVAFVNSNKIDLVVMGTKGRVSDNRLMTGSISISVSQRASPPVILIK